MIKRESEDPLQYTRRNRNSRHSSSAGGKTNCSDQDKVYDNNNVAGIPDNNITTNYSTTPTADFGFHTPTCVNVPPAAYTITIPTTGTIKEKDDSDDNDNYTIKNTSLPHYLTGGDNVFSSFHMLVDVAVARLMEMEREKTRRVETKNG